jgi:GT2 family glycosyltransferase
MQLKNADIPDLLGEAWKSKGIKRLIKKIVFKLTSWMVEPILVHHNNYVNETNSILMKLDQHIKQLNKANLKSQGDYSQWINQNEPTDFELRCQRGFKFANSPKISLVLQIPNAHSSELVNLINSIRFQTYSHWELLVICYSTISDLEKDKLYNEDERIVFCDFDGSEGVLNYVTRQVNGDYIGFLYPADTLAPFAMYEIVNVINENPDADFIYGDDDEIRKQGRCGPYFKPDFAPDALRSTNYIGTFFLTKRSLLAKISKRVEGLGDFSYEVVLHASESAEAIVHVPKILLHKHFNDGRDIAADTVCDGSNSELIKSHAARHLGLDSVVNYTGVDDIYRVDYILKRTPKVAILIPSKDHLELLKPCIESIENITTYDNYEIIVIENNSIDEETFVYYRELERSNRINVVTYPDTGFNYQKIINFGVRSCDAEYIVQLNNDMMVITPNWLEIMLGFAQRNDVGAVGIKLLYPDLSAQHAGGVLMPGEWCCCEHIYRHKPKHARGYKNRELLITNLSWVTGACLMSGRDVFEQVGYMTEDFEVAFGDVDFCMKIRAVGKLVVYNPFVEMIHYECRTRGYDDNPEKQLKFVSEKELFCDKWRKELERGEPYFNPMMEKVLY